MLFAVDKKRGYGNPEYGRIDSISRMHRICPEHMNRPSFPHHIQILQHIARNREAQNHDIEVSCRHTHKAVIEYTGQLQRGGIARRQWVFNPDEMVHAHIAVLFSGARSETESTSAAELAEALVNDLQHDLPEWSVVVIRDVFVVSKRSAYHAPGDIIFTISYIDDNDLESVESLLLKRSAVASFTVTKLLSLKRFMTAQMPKPLPQTLS